MCNYILCPSLPRRARVMPWSAPPAKPGGLPGQACAAGLGCCTSFTFLTLPGHFRGPRRTIQFTILGRGDRLIVRQVGAASLGIFDRAYDGGAWFSWRTQAATLRAALSGGPLGQS